MKLAPKLLVLAVLAAIGPLANAANKPPSEAQPFTALQAPAPAAVKPAATRIVMPDDWIVYDDATYTPVVDAVSRHLNVARKAFDANDTHTAALEMRAVADELKLQASQARHEVREEIKVDAALLAADRKAQRETSTRMSASASKASAAADAIESGHIKTKADLDKAIDKAARADMDRRWLVTDVASWYPLSETPQRLFTDAMQDYDGNQPAEAAANIRKAASYMRLELARAPANVGKELRNSIAQLDKLADGVAKGAMKDRHAIAADFARANHALALTHRANAAESWARKEYNKAAYELKAAAGGLERAAAWAGGAADDGASVAVADTRAVGEKIAGGATWTRDEVGKAFESLGNGINTLGRKIGGTTLAARFHPESGA